MKKPKKQFDTRGPKITFEFENKFAAQYFKSWLCELGEQDYWQWMEYREEEDKNNNITGLDFDYWDGNIIKVRCGRMDGKEK